MSQYLVELDLSQNGQSSFSAVSEFDPANVRLQIAGFRFVPQGKPRAILLEYVNGVEQLFDLNALAGASSSMAFALNNVFPSHVLGTLSTGSGVSRPARWQKSGTSYPAASVAGEARGVNNSGTSVGWVLDASNNHRATLWPGGGGASVDLGDFGGRSSEATAINNAGQVVGWAEELGGGRRAFLWTPGGTDGDPSNPQMLNLGTMGQAYSAAHDINDAGHVVGEVRGGFSGAFFWSPGTGPQLIPGFAKSAVGLGINDHDVVVGYYLSYADEQRAFCWVAGQAGLFNDLNTLIAPSSDLILRVAHDINNRGDIVGSASLANFGSTGFHLTPLQVHIPRDHYARTPRDLRPRWAEIVHILTASVYAGGRGIGIGPNGEVVPIPPHGPADAMLILCLLDASNQISDPDSRKGIQKALLAESRRALDHLRKNLSVT